MKKISLIATEYQDQCAFVEWLRLNKILFTSTQNGTYCTPHEKQKLIKSGLEIGCPDIIIFEPRGIYHGLIIEIKSKIGIVKKIQKNFLELLNRKTYHAIVCFGVDQCIKETEKYLGI